MKIDNEFDFLDELFTKEEIKDLLRALDLKVSGNKDVIINRPLKDQDFTIQTLDRTLIKFT